MNKKFYLFIILILASCRNTVHHNFPLEKTIGADTLATDELPNYETDTLTKTSTPFPLNNILFYWQHFFVIYDYGNDKIGFDLKMSLKEKKSDATVFEYEFSPKYAEDYDFKSDHYFDTINKRHFTDMNFDGFKDFTIYSHGSMPMTSSTNIYLFNTSTKVFDPSDLSDTNIEEIDSINKILSTSSFDWERIYLKKHYFDKKGKVKFSEYISEEYFYPNDTTQKLIRTTTKIINNKELETRTDTIVE